MKRKALSVLLLFMVLLIAMTSYAFAEEVDLVGEAIFDGKKIGSSLNSEKVADALSEMQPGDEITTLHYASSLSGDDEMQLMEIDTFTVGEATAFEEMELGDGDFIMMFRLEDARSESVYSESLYLHCENGEYTIEKAEDM